MNRVFVHVDRVVLRGVGEADKQPTLAALERDLSDAFGNAGWVAGLATQQKIASLRLSVPLATAGSDRPGGSGRVP